MEDPYAFPKPALRMPRVCGAPFCGKPLASLNKRDLCFTCQNRQLLQRGTIAGAGPSVHGSGRR